MAVTALNTLKCAVVVTRKPELDPCEHHASLALWTRTTLNCNKWDDGRQGLRFWHDAHLKSGGSATLSVTDSCRDGAVMKPSCSSWVPSRYLILLGFPTDRHDRGSAPRCACPRNH